MHVFILENEYSILARLEFFPIFTLKYTLTCLTVLHRMALGCLRLALSRAARASSPSTSPATLLLLYKPQSSRATWSYLGIKLQQSTLFSTVAGDDGDVTEDEPQEKKKKKKQDPKARTTISSVGRKIHQRHLLLLDEEGENLGAMHRADALRLMDDKGLKLVPVNEHAEPPVYRLMSGKQIHEEQMKLREKQKTKATGERCTDLYHFHTLMLM